ncbi:peptidogalycan biosysnthesis protein, partial [Streptomyces galilaeus]|uniref:peptidogalycan biosysnthesis protein n=2 Tax=Streptomyces TaxID=1883 RepID=UPI0038F67A14
IEYCINNELNCFHSGAQGEHKIARGFEPVFTHSIHTIIDQNFSLAIADFLKREQRHTLAYLQHCETLLPFKRDV